MTAPGRSTRAVVLLVLRAVLVGAAFVWGCYILLACRTMDYGFDGTSIFLVPFFVLPGAALVCIGMPWKRWIVSALAVCLATVIVAESIAGLEEHLFRRQVSRTPPPAEAVFKDRWWPFGHHFVYYDPDAGGFGGGD